MKKGDESQFLYDTHVETNVDDVIRDIVVIYNGRLKISRLCYGKFILCVITYSLPKQVILNIMSRIEHTFWKFRIISAILKNHNCIYNNLKNEMISCMLFFIEI